MNVMEEDFSIAITVIEVEKRHVLPAGAKGIMALPNLAENVRVKVNLIC